MPSWATLRLPDLTSPPPLPTQLQADLNAFTENYVRKSDAAKSGRINQIYGELKGRVAEEALPKALESYWEILSNPEYGISQLLEDALVEAMCDLEELKAR